MYDEYRHDTKFLPTSIDRSISTTNKGERSLGRKRHVFLMSMFSLFLSSKYKEKDKKRITIFLKERAMNQEKNHYINTLIFTVIAETITVLIL